MRTDKELDFLENHIPDLANSATQQAQKSGYRTYLYFIATQDPLINISRVKNRVKHGGHDVPQEKIISRYYKTLQNLSRAIKYTNRAYIFDNSSHQRTYLAEITDAKTIEIKTPTIPQWFDRYILKEDI